MIWCQSSAISACPTWIRCHTWSRQFWCIQNSPWILIWWYLFFYCKNFQLKITWLTFDNMKLFFHLFNTTQIPLNKLHSFKTHVSLYNVVDNIILPSTSLFVCAEVDCMDGVSDHTLASPPPPCTLLYLPKGNPVIRILTIFYSFNLPNCCKKEIWMKYCFIHAWDIVHFV